MVIAPQFAPITSRDIVQLCDSLSEMASSFKLVHATVKIALILDIISVITFFSRTGCLLELICQENQFASSLNGSYYLNEKKIIII